MEAKSVKLIIDNIVCSAKEGATVLETALDNGIYIPHLCSHENLRPAGACGMCVVTQQGTDGVIKSCSTKVQDGMVIETKSELAEKMRALASDLIFKTHPSECTNCPKYGKCQLQSILQYVGDTGRKLKSNPILTPANNSNPMILHEMYRCILCGRCVRACEDMRGVGAIKFKKIDGRVRVVVNGDDLNEAGCRFCAACVEVCPTGSIREHEEIEKKAIGKTHDEAAVPCKAGCPANVDVPRYIRFIKQGRYSDATSVVRERAALPEVLGYVCTHPCEMECKRNFVNEGVSIRNLKRFAAQNDDGKWREKVTIKPDSGKKAAVIGAGPAGLTAAYYLKKQGHSVTVFEAMPKAGGMLRYGIPIHRLPRDVVDKEIAELTEIGVELITGKRIKNAESLLQEGYDTVFAATGTHSGLKLPLQGNDLAGVYINTDFLRRASEGERIDVGQKVVVIGGGNVALDCASVALRFGAKEVNVACLEARDKMTSSDEELKWALEEGIILNNSVNFLGIEGQSGKVKGLKVVSINGFSFDNTGKLICDVKEGSERLIDADTIIFAIGQRPEIDESFGLLQGRGGRVTVNNKYETSVKGIFSAGDVVTGTASVIQAIASARQAAAEMDKFLGGDGNLTEIIAPIEIADPILGNQKGFGEIPKNESQVISPEIRIQDFCTMDCGLNRQSAHEESLRCLQCDLRLQIAPQRFWSSFEKKEEGGQ